MTDSAELERKYMFAVRAIDAAVLNAVNLSHHSAGRPSATRQVFWSSLFYTRMCNALISALRITPRSGLLPVAASHLCDYSGVATLLRTFVESFAFFYYMGIEAVSEEESLARQGLLYLHDCTARLELFVGGDREREFYQGQQCILREQLSTNSAFSALPEKTQKHYLRGRDAAMLSIEEIAGRSGLDRAEFKWWYRLLSAHVHSLPIAYYRGITDDLRGRGLENDVEKNYILISLNYARSILDLASELYVGVFPDLAGLKSNYAAQHLGVYENRRARRRARPLQRQRGGS